MAIVVWSKRQRTKVLSLSVLGNEVATLRHLLDQERDRLHVRLDCLQGFGIMNEREDVARGAC